MSRRQNSERSHLANRTEETILRVQIWGSLSSKHRQDFGGVSQICS